MPTIAVVMRQPTLDSAPNTASPSEIIHLPSGGCTTNDGWLVKMFTSPALNCLSAFGGQAASYPKCCSV